MAVWGRGRFDGRAGPGRVLFGQMYEDSAIEVAVFPRGGRIFCIASAGCTAIALANEHEVAAVDINPIQVAYALRRFAGDVSAPGSAERVMGLGRAFAPLVGWWPSRLREFLDLDEPAQQIRYWKRYLDSRRFRFGLDALLSLNVLRGIYDPTLLEFLPAHLGSVMRARMERCFARHPNRSNPYVRALLLGELNTASPPDQARHIRVYQADAAEFLEQQGPASFDGFSLSNILDGASDSYRRRLLAAIRQAASPDSVVVLRSFREPPPAMTSNRAADDRTMIWGIVDVRPANTLT